jgi:hypothetical protein
MSGRKKRKTLQIVSNPIIARGYFVMTYHESEFKARLFSRGYDCCRLLGTNCCSTDRVRSFYGPTYSKVVFT